jgi:arylsulfatase A-like enzyme
MRLVRSGAANGLWAFLAYGIVEALFADYLPWVAGRTDVLEWESTAILLAVYAVAGVMLGALGGAIVSALRVAEPERAVRAAAVLAVALPYTINAARVTPAMAVALPLGAALAVAAWALVDARRGAGSWLSYWAVAFILAGAPAVSKDLLLYHPRVVRAGGAAAFSVVVIAAAYFTRNFKFRPQIVAALAIVLAPIFFLLRPALGVPGPEMLRASGASGKPNVILMVLDTVRADHLSLYGYSRATTPELRKLAAQATVYTNAISASDMTLASHASLFTGMYPTWHQAHYSGDSPMGRPLADGFRTLAEILADYGYLTAGVGSNVAFLQHLFGLDQGFRFWSVRGGFFLERDGFWLRQGVRRLVRPVVSRYRGMSYRRAGEINTDVFRMLDSVRGSKRPFFMFINYMDAHWPYEPPQPFDALYPHGGPAYSDAGYYDLSHKVMTLKHKMTGTERDRLVGPYDGAITYLDSEVGRVIARLKAQGLYENTLLIITADHGETFGERNFVNHSVSVYQDQVRVPLVVKFPHTNRAAVVERVVSSVDVMPTVLAAAGLAVPASVQGDDLLRTGSSRDVFAESFPNIRYCNLHPRFLRVQRAIFRGSRKLVTSTAGNSELFDIARDPDELRDLAGSEGGVAAELRAALDRSLRGAVVDALRRPGADPRFGKTEVERLKSLGYVQ